MATPATITSSCLQGVRAPAFSSGLPCAYDLPGILSTRRHPDGRGCFLCPPSTLPRPRKSQESIAGASREILRCSGHIAGLARLPLISSRPLAGQHFLPAPSSPPVPSSSVPARPCGARKSRVGTSPVAPPLFAAAGPDQSTVLRWWLPQCSEGANKRGKGKAPRASTPAPALGEEGLGLGVGQEEEDEEISPDIPPPPPPSSGRLEIIVDKANIRSLDLSSAHSLLRTYMAKPGDWSSPPPSDVSTLLTTRLGFSIQYERDDPLDPRELSEFPDIRLWFVLLDVAYPWLPAVLDWRGGELGRYAAMLVPHQMSRRMGLVFNPEALELWTMNKAFLVYTWVKARNVPRPESRVRDMMKVLGLLLQMNCLHS